jgi:heme exporter protein B
MGLFILPLFLMLLAENVADPLLLLLTTALGLLGVAAAGTLVAALTIGSAVHGGLFSILMLPVILPVFLPAISLTTGALGGEAGSLSYLGGLALYDMILMVGASLLFDYLWYEE